MWKVRHHPRNVAKFNFMKISVFTKTFEKIVIFPRNLFRNKSKKLLISPFLLKDYFCFFVTMMTELNILLLYVRENFLKF